MLSFSERLELLKIKLKELSSDELIIKLNQEQPIGLKAVDFLPYNKKEE